MHRQPRQDLNKGRRRLSIVSVMVLSLIVQVILNLLRRYHV
jgi:hypothetical protein